MRRATWVKASYKSIDDGLDELQKFHLSQELRKDHSRQTKSIRSIAKEKAFKTRVRWFFEEALMVAGLFLVCLFIVVALFIWQL
ncbi:hypothetical protein [Paenibacillus periandrae]|uniref:hypothetical protein n=1 Tax=Paenibacillus periandrae TaxID=1761741 RepID=UPI001F095057|nr:hypothetical protein [Paenibacillus periandrae]